jgi:hypothetical protein
MIKFIVTIDGCIAWRTSANNSCDAIIAAKERYPTAIMILVRPE